MCEETESEQDLFAIPGWRIMTDEEYDGLARPWTLTDDFIVDGRRYVPADGVENPLELVVHEWLDALEFIWLDGNFYTDKHGWQGVTSDARTAKRILIQHKRLAEDGSVI